MDYFDLLHQAQQNNKSAATKEVRCYSTSFSPPKKVSKNNVSGENIKKFLARKEEEERKRLLQEKKKKEELLALRALDKKAQKRVQVMLKKTKSANKSVMEDAIDNVNTADTLAGPQMCDDDDYGYVSQEASALYEKLMSKYQNIPAEASKAMTREVKDISATKDRVKAALRKEEEEELNPHRKRKRKAGNEDNKDKSDETEIEDEIPSPVLEDEKKDKEESKKNKKKMPPPVDFFQLLKIAEQKQHEPIIIEKKVPKDNERPMTMKQKLEYQREMERKSGKKSSTSPALPSNQISNEKSKNDPVFNKRIPKKENPEKKLIEEKISVDSSKVDRKNPNHEKTVVNSAIANVDAKSSNIKKKVTIDEKSFSSLPQEKIPKKIPDYSSVKPKLNDESLLKSNNSHFKQHNITKTQSKMKPEKISETKSSSSNLIKKNENEMSSIDKEIEMLLKKKAMLMQEKALQDLQTTQSDQKKKLPENGKLIKKQRESDVTEPVPKKVMVNNLSKQPAVQNKPPIQSKPQLPQPSKSSVHNKPPLQTKINNGTKNEISLPNKKLLVKPSNKIQQSKKPPIKRRVIDSESEYDSELDDFIDDGPEEGMDYSKHIKEIFGYDKSRYMDLDDDECEVASFRTQMIEEKRSAKIGLLEDLADIQREKEEKARALMRKKQKSINKR